MKKYYSGGGQETTKSVDLLFMVISSPGNGLIVTFRVTRRAGKIETRREDIEINHVFINSTKAIEVGDIISSAGTRQKVNKM